MFNSYETGRTGFVTLVANYIPLQDAYGGPNYFTLDPNGRYNINIDNNGDAVADIVFQFRAINTNKDISLTVGESGNNRQVSVPVVNVGPITAGNTTNLNVIESYFLDVQRGSTTQPVINPSTGRRIFTKPVDNIGNKSLPDYATYANSYIYNNVQIPGCSAPGSRVFVGQRKDPFIVNLGEVFDLVNVTNPLGSPSAETDDLADKNVTSFILEIPASCLTSGGEPVIAGWTSSVSPSPTQPNTLVQVSRLGNPLVNEVVIGLKDKDRFNASRPQDDAQFADYVGYPTFPEILELLFGAAGVQAPNLFPRADLQQVFLTGVPGLNQPQTQTRPAELMRLNTSIAATPAASQSNLGVVGGDLAGYPNGRRPGDDIVDITLRAAMGVLLTPAQAPSGQLPFTDGALSNSSFFDTTFPYLKTPIAGSPNASPTPVSPASAQVSTARRTQ